MHQGTFIAAAILNVIGFGLQTILYIQTGNCLDDDCLNDLSDTS